MNMEEEEDNDETMITSKLQLVLAAKSRKLQYISSSPITSHHHMSLSLSSSPDDSLSRASVPFSWEEEPGKPKYHRFRHPSVSKCLVLPPRLLLPDDITKTPLTLNHHRLRLTGFKRWFWWRKGRTGNDSFFFPYEDHTRARGLHCLSYVTKCYFWTASSIKEQ